MSSKKIVLSILGSFVLMILLVSSFKGANGSYLFAKIVYPYTMILLILFSKIGNIPWFLVIVQIPIYTLLIETKPKAKFYIPIIHIILALICVLLPTDIYL